jgi:ABC-type nitrate/sulfonate/bicarbonate transport system ATPase subunit
MTQAAKAPPKLVVRDLTQRFGTVAVLDHLNLEIRDREFVCILGASGCGKSTLFNAVSGLLQVTSGSILLDGQDIVGRPGQVGYMLQKDLLLPWRSVLDNIVLGASLTRGATKAERKRAAELATRYGLGDFLHHYPQALSGGMRQRVALMRTIAAARELILLDEPFGALDSQTRLGMQQWLLEVWQDMARTVLFVTHDVDEAIFLADRLIVMLPRPGRIGLMLDVNIARPRDTDSLTSPEFTALKREIMNILYGHPSHPGAANTSARGSS